MKKMMMITIFTTRGAINIKKGSVFFENKLFEKTMWKMKIKENRNKDMGNIIKII